MAKQPKEKKDPMVRKAFEIPHNSGHMRVFTLRKGEEEGKAKYTWYRGDAKVEEIEPKDTIKAAEEEMKKYTGYYDAKCGLLIYRH